MQTIYLDISNKGVVPTVYAKQKEVGRKFAVILTDSGLPYIPEVGSVFSVWYKGASGEGNYTDIGDKPAFSLSGNKVEVEMIVQMLSAHGDGILCLTLNSPNGNQISSWNIPYMCEIVPGSESEKAEEYYTAFSKAVEKLPSPDASLSVHGKAADAAAVGAALSEKAPAGYGLGGSATMTVGLGDMDSLRHNGWYNLAAPGSNLAGVGFNYANVHVHSDADDTFWQEIRPVSSDAIVKRHCHNGVFAEWVCDNPPMNPGVEYRTSKVYKDKPVYAKLIQHQFDSSISAGDAATNFQIPHGISNLSEGWFVSASGGQYMLPYSDAAGYTLARFKSDNIEIEVKNGGWGATYVWRFFAEYIKTTD